MRHGESTARSFEPFFLSQLQLTSYQPDTHHTTIKNTTLIAHVELGRCDCRCHVGVSTLPAWHCKPHPKTYPILIGRWRYVVVVWFVIDAGEAPAAAVQLV